MKRTDVYLSLACITLSLILYIHTLAPGLLYGDSAELQTIAYTMGLGHPTGYVVYVLTAKIFTLLFSIGEIAYRVNLFSAVAASITVALIYLITRTLDNGIASSLLASLMLALTPLFWRYASLAEVYAFASMWLAIILFSLLKWTESKRRYWLIIAGLFGGLSLGVHTMIPLAAPAILVYLVVTSSNIENFWKRIGPSLWGLMTGVAIFILLFLFLDHRNASAGYYNSVAVPSLSVWGVSPLDFDSPLERLAFLYFPPQFRGLFFAVPLNIAWIRLLEFLHEYYGLVIFGIAGIVSFFVSTPKLSFRPREGWLFIVALTIFMVFALTYDVADYYVYYTSSILILAICAGRGLQGIISLTEDLQNNKNLIATLVTVACYIIGLLNLATNLPRSIINKMPPGLEEKQREGFQFPGTYKIKAEKIIENLEENAIAFTNWDRVYTLYYVAIIDQGRTGLDFHQIDPAWNANQPVPSITDYINQNIDSRPIYFMRYPDLLSDYYIIIQVNSDIFKIEKK